MNLYVIGPVTGRKDRNIDEFQGVAEDLRNAGYGCVIPHQVVPRTKNWEEAIHLSIEELTHCERGGFHYDGVAMLPGWEQSRGAKIEHDLAVALGIPCKPWREWLEVAKGGAPLAAEGASQPVFAPAC